MKIKTYLFWLLFASISYPSFSFAQNVTSTPQNQQMLQQIQQLQQQQIAQQGLANQPTTTPRVTVAGSNISVTTTPLQSTTPNAVALTTNQTAQVSAATATATRLNQKLPSSPSFPAPFDRSQLPVSGTETQIVRHSFKGTVRNLLPMTPAQIHHLKQLYTASQYAAAAPPGAPPKPAATSMLIDLSPGSTPPVIRLAEGFVTSLVFVDATGAPWPIAAYDIGNPNAFNIQWDKKDNNLMIQANSLYTYGNLAVRLRDLDTPVMITLIPGQAIVDYRVDMRIPGYGPEAKILPVTNGLPPTESPMLLQVLDGVPPEGGRVLVVSGGPAQAWLVGDIIYLRTQMTLLSPGWLSTMSSADGTNAYELEKTPRLLASLHGKVIQLRIKGL